MEIEVPNIVISELGITEIAVGWTIVMWLIAAYFCLPRLEHPHDEKVKKMTNWIWLAIIVVWIGGIGFDQYKLHQSRDLSVPNSELNDTQLKYREAELEYQKEKLTNRNEKTDKVNSLIEEVQQEKQE